MKKEYLVYAVIAAVFYYIGAKNPGLLSKVGL